MSIASIHARMIGKLAAFAKCNRGNFAMMFGLTALPMALAAGTGVDLARTMVARTQMADALDAAGLAVGATNNLTNAQMTELARQYFNANYKASTSATTPTPVTVVQQGQDIVVSTGSKVPTTLMNLVGIKEIPVNVSITVTRSSVDLEVALALDTTGSMSGTKIADLKVAAKDLIDMIVQDNQTLNYSKVALVPYSLAVNVGSYATSVRGPIAPGKPITNAVWTPTNGKNITKVTKANPAVVTSNSHGFSNGTSIYISGVVGMTQLNGREYTVSNTTSDTFRLKDSNGNTVSSSSYSNYSSGGKATKCSTATGTATITSNAHGFNVGDVVTFDGVGGMTQLNQKPFTVISKTTNSFVVSGADDDCFDAFTSGGSAFCTTAGCQWLYFSNNSGGKRLFEISTCVSERTGTNAYTDAAPATTYFGRNYPAPSNSCTTPVITPLSTDRSSLKTAIDNLTAGGSTGGHIGVGWTWYMLSPNFNSLWPAQSQPAAYGRERLLKVAVIMTDGEYNSMYCNGVISQDSTNGSGSVSDHINCNAPNGHAFDQATQQCARMKESGVIVYTVGFQVVSDPRAQALVSGCATSSSHVYLPTTGAELKTSFRAIGQEITQLRLAK